MNSIHWRFLLVGVAMLVAAGAAPVLKPSRAPHDTARPDLETMLPRSFNGWTVDASIVPIAPAPDVRANVDRIYDQIVSRTYVNARREQIMLTVAYGGDQSDALKAHRQEVCYAAQGFRVGGVSHEALRLGDRELAVTRMLAVRGRRSEPVTYWLTMGDRVVLGRLERLIVQLRYGLSGTIPDGMLVRVSSLSTEPTRAFQAQQDFIVALLGGMRRSDVPRLFGSLS